MLRHVYMTKGLGADLSPMTLYNVIVAARAQLYDHYAVTTGL